MFSINLTIVMLNLFYGDMNVFVFSIISQHRNAIVSLGPFLLKKIIHSSCIVNSMVVDVLLMQGAGVSAAVLLT